MYKIFTNMNHCLKIKKKLSKKKKKSSVFLKKNCKKLKEKFKESSLH